MGTGIQRNNRKRPSNLCINCDATMDGKETANLFCSERCRQEAEWVRYVRRCLRDNRIKRPDVQEAIRIRLGHVLAGGYERYERRVPPDIRAAVEVREKGRCQVCGGAGTELHHIDGSCSTPANLELLCAACHRKITLARMRTLGDSHMANNASPAMDHIVMTKDLILPESLWQRVQAEPALRICDDEVKWPQQWRRLRAERRE